MDSVTFDTRAINRLKAGSSYYGCGRYLKCISEVERQEIYAHFEFERLENKYQDIVHYYKNEAGENWNQTLFIYLFRYLGDPKNKETYMKLAKRIGYNAVLKERGNPLRLEALILGASGLLKDFGVDHYTLNIRSEAEYLMRKYAITPLSSRDWNMYKINPKNHPVLRLSQAATLFNQNELMFDKFLLCRNSGDVEELLMVEASEYWTTHYVPARVSVSEVKRLGSDKCNVLAINLVVMLQFAYGSYTSNDKLIEQAHNLLQDLRLERNQIITGWLKHGLRPKTAFESQALIQIGSQYCTPCRCEECFIAPRAIRNFGWLDSK